jgi:DNA polymerase-3 subunit gamma/tau
VQGRKRVAWMQLSNASVSSFEDGVLTLVFAQAGTAKGFLTGGYDQVLGQVIADMFGLTPRITTSVGAGVAEAGTSTASSRAARDDDRPDVPPPARDGGPGQDTRDQARAPAGAARQAAGERRPARRTGGPASPPPAAGGRAAASDEPHPDDRPDPDTLTGSSLIERELGGRIIRELDE